MTNFQHVLYLKMPEKYPKTLLLSFYAEFQSPTGILTCTIYGLLVKMIVSDVEYTKSYKIKRH